MMHGPNMQNDRVWATCNSEIEDDVRYRQMVKHPDCIGLFVCFMAKGLTLVVKERGETWDGAYFRETILVQNVLRFL